MRQSHSTEYVDDSRVYMYVGKEVIDEYQRKRAEKNVSDIDTALYISSMLHDGIFHYLNTLGKEVEDRLDVFTNEKGDGFSKKFQHDLSEMFVWGLSEEFWKTLFKRWKEYCQSPDRTDILYINHMRVIDGRPLAILASRVPRVPQKVHDLLH